MNRILLIICLWQIFTFALGRLEPINYADPLPGKRPPAGDVWPKLYLQTFSSNNVFSVDTQNFDINILQDGIPCDGISFAVNHYRELIRNLESEKGGEVRQLDVIVKNCKEEFPTFANTSQEAYDIQILQDVDRPPMATLNAEYHWGVIRGLETFYQLIWSNMSSENGSEQFFVNETTIVDFPRFRHRGLLIDSARHYLPESVIAQVMTGMMYNKLNVLHWHIVDDQSFPFVSSKFSELSEKGAYHKNGLYTPETVAKLQNAARDRGIKIMFEFDTPGHTAGFGKSHPELLTPCHEESTHNEIGPNIASAINFDPSQNFTFDFMEEFLQEIAVVSKDKFVHLGFDEVFLPCWQSAPNIKKLMQEQNFTSYYQVQQYYLIKIVDMARNLGLVPVIFEDLTDYAAQVDKDVIVHFWYSRPEHAKYQLALVNGYNIIQSACWYINLLKYGQAWRNYYECDPIPYDEFIPLEKQVLGGEAAIWGEFVDQTNVMPTLFPAIGAVAEVLWSPRETRDNTDDAMWRLDEFRCSLLRRKIPAQPILNGVCGDFEIALDW